jgi:hypothetical protein
MAARGIRPSDWFTITDPRHFGFRRRFQCRRIERTVLDGNPDAAPLDLGLMVLFAIPGFEPGSIVIHAVPITWCLPAESPAPRVAPRVKPGRRPKRTASREARL